MSLETRINEDMKTAMREKDKLALEAIRAIKSAILLAKTEGGAKESLSSDDELKLLTKLKKQRIDSATIFRQQNRLDLAEPEEAQIAIIERYLPQQLSETEITAVISAIITETGAAGIKDMGKVMGAANQRMAGQADGKTISAIVKQLLNA
jgi:uncharacterized protein YqeY